MKVKDLIKNLEKLDQDKDISIIYDGVARIKDIEIDVANDDNCNMDNEDIGNCDYIINVW